MNAWDRKDAIENLGVTFARLGCPGGPRAKPSSDLRTRSRHARWPSHHAWIGDDAQKREKARPWQSDTRCIVEAPPQTTCVQRRVGGCRRRTRRSEYWRRPESLESFVLGDRQDLGNIVQTSDPEAPEGYRLGPGLRTRTGLFFQRPQSFPQSLIHDILETRVATLPQAFQARSDVGVEGQGRSHASYHDEIDVLMSMLSEIVISAA
jgi:hypothetical protein